jgi:hypothetical protein
LKHTRPLLPASVHGIHDVGASAKELVRYYPSRLPLNLRLGQGWDIIPVHDLGNTVKLIERIGADLVDDPRDGCSVLIGVVREDTGRSHCELSWGSQHGSDPIRYLTIPIRTDEEIEPWLRSPVTCRIMMLVSTNAVNAAPRREFLAKHRHPTT